MAVVVFVVGGIIFQDLFAYVYLFLKQSRKFHEFPWYYNN